MLERLKMALSAPFKDRMCQQILNKQFEEYTGIPGAYSLFDGRKFRHSGMSAHDYIVSEGMNND